MHEQIQKFCSFKVGQSSARKKERRMNAPKLGNEKGLLRWIQQEGRPPSKIVVFINPGVIAVVLLPKSSEATLSQFSILPRSIVVEKNTDQT